MKRTLRVVSVVVTVAIVAGASAASAAVGEKKKPKPPVALTAAQIQGALLALTDMPTGWAVFHPTNEGQASATDGLCNGPNAKARADTAGETAYGTATYAQDPKNGPAISEVLNAYPTVDAAKALMTATRLALNGCQTWSVPGPNGITMSEAATPLSFAKIGDDAVAVRETSTNMFEGQPGATAVADTVVIRKGNHVVLVTRVGVSADPAQLQTFAATALSKFGVALAAAQKTAQGHKK